MVVEIQERHVQLVRRVAAVYKIRFPWTDYDDLFSEGLMSLYLCSFKWPGEGDFEPYLWVSAANAMKLFVRKELNRQRIAKMLSGDSLDEDHVHSLFDKIENPENIEDIIQAKLLLGKIAKALEKEKPVVREAVYRLDTDTNLAKKYGLKSVNSLIQFRKRFLRDFEEGLDS